MPKITVHHLNRSRSMRILFLLEELGLDYEIVRYRRDPRTQRAPPELLRIHPLGKSPVVVVDTVILAESGAIVETLVEEHGHGALRPEPGTPEHRLYRFFLHYAEGSLMPPLLVALIAKRVKRAPVPFFLRPVVQRIGDQLYRSYPGPELERHARFLDAHLAEHDWFAGSDFTAADIQLSFGVEAGLDRGFPSDVPHLKRWMGEIRARPAHQRAVARSGED